MASNTILIGELFGQGLANLAAPPVGGVLATAAIARTAVNVRAGATSRLAAFTHALALAAIVLAAAPLVEKFRPPRWPACFWPRAIQMIEVGPLAAITRATRSVALCGSDLQHLQPTGSALASSGTYTDGLHALQSDGFSSGALTTVPVYVSHATHDSSVVTSLEKVSSLRGAVAPTDVVWRVGGSAIVIAIPQHEVGSSQSGSAVADIRSTVPRDSSGRWRGCAGHR